MVPHRRVDWHHCESAAGTADDSLSEYHPALTLPASIDGHHLDGLRRKPARPVVPAVHTRREGPDPLQPDRETLDTGPPRRRGLLFHPLAEPLSVVAASGRDLPRPAGAAPV